MLLSPRVGMEVASPTPPSPVALESRPTSASIRPSTINPAAVQADVTVFIRPMLGLWQMGEDWEVTVPYNSTFVDFKTYIEEHRGICRHRIQIRLKGRIVQPAREKWTLRRMGINQGMILLVEPTMAGSWWWNPYSYYRDALLSQIESVIKSEGGGLFLPRLMELVQMPPPITTSLRVFLRTYPERIHMYTNVTDNSIWVQKAAGLISIPTFSPVPHNLGYFDHFCAPPPETLHVSNDSEDEEDHAKEPAEVKAGEATGEGNPDAPRDASGEPERSAEDPQAASADEPPPSAESALPPAGAASARPSAASQHASQAMELAEKALRRAGDEERSAPRQKSVSKMTPEELEHHIALNAEMT